MLSAGNGQSRESCAQGEFVGCRSTAVTLQRGSCARRAWTCDLHLSAGYILPPRGRATVSRTNVETSALRGASFLSAPAALAVLMRLLETLRDKGVLTSDECKQ